MPPACGLSGIDHASFEKSALVGSLDRLLASGAAPSADFERGYQAWKKANGGIFTIGVAQVMALFVGPIDMLAPARPTPAT